MSNSPKCPQCSCENVYIDGSLWICPECFHEWTTQESATPTEAVFKEDNKFVDANGLPLQNGDTVSTVKDLKVGKDTLKSGTKVKNIRLLDEPVDGHDISCKIEGFGSIYLKCSVVKKVSK